MKLLRSTLEAFRERGLVYIPMGFVAFFSNLLTYVSLGSIDQISAQGASVIAFFTGGQVGYLLHSRFSFSDRRPNYGWFILGNLGGLGINALAYSLLEPTNLVTGLVYLGALAPSAAFTFAWNNHISHGMPKPRHRKEK